MRRVIDIFAAFDAVHGQGASLREGSAILLLFAVLATVAFTTAIMFGEPI